MLNPLKRGPRRERRSLTVALSLSLVQLRSKGFISEFHRGGSEAFSKVYSVFNKPILRYVRSKIADAEIAEELTQEVFLKAFRFRESYQDQYAFSTWLWTIARNTVADHLRSTRAGSVQALQDEDPLMPDEIPCGRPCAESMAINKDQRRTFMTKLKSLTRLQRRVVWMRVIHQLSYEEISKRLDISLSAVKNLMYRAKLSLGAGFVLGPLQAGMGLA